MVATQHVSATVGLTECFNSNCFSTNILTYGEHYPGACDGLYAVVTARNTYVVRKEK